MIIQLTITNKHSKKTCWNSEHIVSLRCLALVWVICPVEKSKTSSESNFKITILFWHMDSFVLLAPTMSGMNDCQFFGHSRFRIWRKCLVNNLCILVLYVFYYMHLIGTKANTTGKFKQITATEVAYYPQNHYPQTLKIN